MDKEMQIQHTTISQQRTAGRFGTLRLFASIASAHGVLKPTKLSPACYHRMARLASLDDRENDSSQSGRMIM